MLRVIHIFGLTYFHRMGKTWYTKTVVRAHIMPKKKQIPLRFFTVILLTLFLAWGGGIFRSAWAQTAPQASGQKAGTINVSAYVLTPENDEVLNGEYEVRFSIYTKDRTELDAYPSNADAGARVWEETQKVTVYNGVMNAELGSVAPFPAGLTFDGGEYYLGIRINQDAEISPRKKLGTVPMAINSQFLNGKQVGTAEGDIPTLGAGGKLDAATMPTITTLGTVKKGVWQGTVVADKYIAKALTGKTYNGLTLTTSGSASLSVSGTAAIDQELLTSSTPTFAGLQLSSVTTPTTPNAGALYSDGTGLYFYNGLMWSDLTKLGSGGVSGVGTVGRLAVWTGLTEIGSATLSGSNGIALTSGLGNFSVGLDLTSGSEDATTGTASSKSGLEITANGLQLVGGCSDGQVLEWETSIGGWACSSKTGGTSDWTTAGGTITYLTDTGDNFAVGGTSAATAIFGIDRTNGQFRFASDSATSPNPTLSFHSNGGADGSIAFTNSGIFDISSGVRFSAASLLATPQSGAVEYSSGDLYFTNGSGTRDRIALLGDVSGSSHPALSIVNNGYGFVSFAGGSDYTDQKVTLSQVRLASEVQGILPTANGGTGLTLASPANGRLLIGNGSGFTLAAPTAGTGIAITNPSAGAMTIATNLTNLVGTGDITNGTILPEDVNVGSDVPASGDFLTYDSAAGFLWTSASGAGLGTISNVGDVSSGPAFTATGTQGTKLYFYDADGRGQLKIADLTGAQTYTLPDASGTVLVQGASGNLSLIDTVGTITSGTWNGTAIDDNHVADAITVDTGTVRNSAITLSGTSNTASGRISWDAVTGHIVVGTGTGTTEFYSGAGAGGIGGSGTLNHVAYWTASGTLAGEAQLAATRGGTGIGTYTTGDLLYANSATTLNKLSDVATGNVLISGGVGVAPSWGKVGLSTHVSGILGVANGGTGISTIPTNEQILVGNGSNGYSLSTLTQGTGIAITNNSGLLTIGTSLADIITTGDIANGQILAEDMNIDNSPVGTQFLAYNSSTGGFTWTGVSSSSGILKVGNASNATKAFTSDAGSQYGSELYFHSGATYTGRLYVGSLTSGRNYALPNATGTILTTGNFTDITGVGTIISGTWNGGSIGNGFIDDDLTINGGSVSNSSIVLQDVGYGDSTAGNITWDSANGHLVVGNGSTQSVFYPGAGAGGLTGTGTQNYAAYWTGSGSLGAEQYLSAARGGTGIGTYTKGDLLIAGSNNPTALSKLSDVATGSVLVSQGLNMAPTWSKVDLVTDAGNGYVQQVRGILPIANGGTGLSTAPTDGQLLIGNTATGVYSLATLSQGDGMVITNAGGSIQIASAFGTSIDTNDILNNTIRPIDLYTSGSATDGYVLMYTSNNGGQFYWENPSGGGSGGLGDINAVGDVPSGPAFTETGGGSQMWFHDATSSFYGLLETDHATTPLTDNRTYKLPDASGTIALIEQVGAASHPAVSLDQSSGANYLTLNAGTQTLTEGKINLGFTSHVTGTLGAGNGGTGNGAPTNGQILVGNNSSGYTLKTIGAGDGLSLANGTSTISFAVDVTTTGHSTNKSSNSGLEVSSDGVRLLSGCSDGEILSWNAVDPDAPYWECASRTSGNSSWTQDTPNNVTYLTDTTSDFAVGGASLTGAAFSVDVSAVTVKLGISGGSSNPSLLFTATNGTTGTIGFGGTANTFTLDKSLSLPAGDASRPSLKIAKSTVFSGQVGAVEAASNGLYFTPESTATRRRLAFYDEVTGSAHNAVTLTKNGLSYLDLSNQELIMSAISLGSDVSGTLSVAHGGTGLDAVTANGILYGNGTDAMNIASGTSAQLLLLNGSGVPTFMTMSGDATMNASGSITIGNDKVALGTKTTGNYVANVSNGNGIGVTGTAGEGWAPTVALGNLTSNWTQTGAYDIVLDNANSELAIKDAGGTHYGTFDVGTLAQDQTYTFPDTTGTVAFGTGTAGNVAYWSDAHTLASESALALSRGGTGLSISSSPTNGQLLVGTGTGFAVGSIAAQTNSGITVTNGSGSITIGKDFTGNNGLITTNDIHNGTLLAADLSTTNSPNGTDGLVLTYSLATGGFTWVNPGAVGAATMTAVGDVTSGAAFTETGSAGTKLYFHNGSFAGQLTVATLDDAKTYTLPNASGTILVQGINGNLGTIDKVGTIGSGIWQGEAIADAYISNALTLGAGSSISATDIALKQSTSPAPTAEGRIEWDSDDNVLVIGDGAGQQTFYPGHGAGGIMAGSGNVAGYAAYWSGSGTIAGEAQLSPSRGGTGLGSYAVGDMLYASGTEELSAVSVGASGRALLSNGTVPTWSTIDLSNTNTVSGTLGVGNGGTGINTTPTGGKILIGTSGGGYSLANISQGSGISVTSGSGSISIATNLNDYITTSHIVNGTILPVDLNSNSVAPNDTEVLTYDAASQKFKWVSPSSGGVFGTFTAIGDTTTGTTAFTQSGNDGTTLYFHKGNVGTLTTATLSGPRTYTLPDATGDVITTGNLSSITAVGTITGSSSIWHGATIADAYIADNLTISGGAISNTDINLKAGTTVSNSDGRVVWDSANNRMLVGNSAGSYETFYPGVGASGLVADGTTNVSGYVSYWGVDGKTVKGEQFLSATRGGTGFGSYAVGDMLYADTTSSLAKLPDAATGNVLLSGGANTAPQWGKVSLTSHITGTLGYLNGGTGTTTIGAAGTIAYSDGAKYAFGGTTTAAGQALVSGTSGTGAPTWFAPTQGSVVFSGANGALSQDNDNFFWDDGNNRLGIGTTTPGAMLSLYGANNKLRLGYDASNFVDMYSTSASVFKIDTNANTEPILRLNDGTERDASIQFDGPSTHDYYDVYAGLDNDTHSFMIGTGTSVGANALFTINPTGTGTGNVGIGMGSNLPTSRLQVTNSVTSNYVAKIINSGNNVNSWGMLVQAGETTPYTGNSTLVQFADGGGNLLGSITNNSADSQTHYNTTSDERLKENIRDTAVGLDDLMKVQVRDFTYKRNPNGNTVHGFIAQELYKVYPNAVTVPEDEDHPWLVDYSSLTPLLVKAVQDQQKEIDAQTKSFAEMEKKLATMEEENKALADFFTALGPDTLVSKDALGNVDLAQGKLESAGVVAGVFTVKVTDKDARTIGSDIIVADTQASDATESEVLVKTTAVTKNSKVFVTPKDDVSSPLSIAKVCTEIDETSCKDKGFIVRVKEKISKDIDFDWVIVEEKS